MKNPRFWRNLCLALAIAGALAVAAAAVIGDDASRQTLQAILMVAGLAVLPISAVGALMLSSEIRRYDALDRGEGVICRYHVSPDDWRRFAQINRQRVEANGPLWSFNEVAVPDTIAESVEIVATKNALKVGDAYHAMGLGGFQGVRWLEGKPDSVEFFYVVPKGKGSTLHYVTRFPVAPGAERQVNALVALYNTPVPLTRIGRILSAPRRAADRNPRKARNIALWVAAVGLTLGGALISQAKADWAREAMNTDIGAFLIIGGAVAGPLIAMAALVLAAIWHTRPHPN